MFVEILKEAKTKKNKTVFIDIFTFRIIFRFIHFLNFI